MNSAMVGAERKPKVYIVSQYVDRSQNSTGYYWNKIINGLASLGTAVSAISTSASLVLAGSFGSNVECIPVGHPGDYKYSERRKRGLAFAGLRQLALSISFSRVIVKHVRKGDFLFSGTNPSLSVLFVSFLKPFVGYKWILLVHDVFPENLVAARIASKRGVVYPLLKLLFDRAYRNADSLVAIGRDMQELLVRKTGAGATIEYVPNWVDIADFSVAQRSCNDGFSATPTDRVVFQFFGNLGRVQGIEMFLEAIAKVRSKNAAFSFIGSGAGEAAVKDFITSNPHIDVVYAPGKPFEKNNEILSACDVAIIPLTPGMFGLGVPSKAYFSMAVDKPILVVGDEGSELQRMLLENPQVGWFCRSGSSEGLARIIEEICAADRAGMVNKPRTLVAEKYSLEKMILRYSAILERLERA